MSKWRDKWRIKKAKERDEHLRTQILANLSTSNEKGLLCFLLIFQEYLPVICEFPFVDDHNYFCREDITCDLLLTDGEKRYLVIQFKYFEDILTASRRSRSHRLRDIKWQASVCSSCVYDSKQKSAGYVTYSVFTNEFRDFTRLELTSKFDLYCQIVFEENMKENLAPEIIKRLKEEITLPLVKIRREKRPFKKPKNFHIGNFVIFLVIFYTIIFLTGIFTTLAYFVTFIPKLLPAGLILIGISIMFYILFLLILVILKCKKRIP